MEAYVHPESEKNGANLVLANMNKF